MREGEVSSKKRRIVWKKLEASFQRLGRKETPHPAPRQNWVNPTIRIPGRREIGGAGQGGEEKLVAGKDLADL